MRLLSIECEYFRQHVDSRISFSQGLTGIVGANGAGKSTLVEAISFALFGSRAVRGKVEGIVTRGTRRKRPLVRLRFEHGGHGFVVERTTANATLFMGGEKDPVVSGGRAVSERIQELLGLSFDEFIATYFTEQKGLEFLSGKKGATERSRFIIQMMGYDRLERAQELLRRDRRDLKNKILGVESSLQDEEALKDRVRQEETSLKSLEEELQRMSKILETSLAKYTLEEAEWRKLEAEKKQADEHAARLEGIRVRIEAAVEHIASTEKQKEKAEAEVQELWQSVAPWNGAYEVFLEELTGIQSRLAAAQENFESLRSQWESERVAASSALGVATATLESQKGALKELQRLESAAECPTCGQQLGSTYLQSIKKNEERVAELRDTVEKATAALAEKKQVPVEIETQSQLIATLKEKQASLTTVQPAFNQIKRIAAAQSELTQGIDQKQSEIKTLEESRTTLMKEQQRLSYTPKNYSERKAAYETARQLLEVNRMNRLRHESAVEKQQALLIRSKEDLSRAREARLLLEEQRREMLLLDESDAAFTEIRRSLNTSIRPRLADLASEFLADLTDGRYTSVEIGEDFSPTVFEDGEPKPVISGGEQDILNLCVRLALSQLVAERAGHSISLLILDEVFGSLDENRRYNVLMLLEKLQNRFDQVLLITHLDDIKEGVHHFINVEYDEGSGEVRIDALDSYETLAMNI